jgi:hypothetical protein
MPEAEKPLTDDEIRDVRKMLQRHGHSEWFWATVKQASLWITAIVVGANHGWNALIKLIRFLSSQDSGD